MKVSINWLKQYVDINDLSIEQLEELFSLKLSEVEEAYQLANLEGLTIGHVLECEEHPDSDHLHVCQVEIRPGEVKQIVCGAPNVKKGVKVIVANPGCVLPGDFKIKPSKIRGVESNGMLCSLQELGIPDKYVLERFKDGIFLFGEDAPVGEDAIKYLGFDDYVFDLSITPNRADMLSMIGVAYDVASALGKAVNIEYPIVPEVEQENDVKVEVKTNDCYQYNARKIIDVEVKESPLWLQERLIAAGIRPINNIVDISNYILIEYGQPLHTFDGDKLGNHILVRNAQKDEKFVTLDEIERTLTEQDIVITDGNKPVCLGGVMGGLNTGVDNNTKTVVLEAAEFNPSAIRKTSARLGLRSESSYRFERKIDSLRVEKAMEAATMMIVELAGGKVLKGIKTEKTREFKELEIAVSLDKINSYMGIELPLAEVKGILDNMQFEYKEENGNFLVHIPSRRIDYDNNYQDIIEDIARFYGYDNIPLSIPKTSDCGHLTKEQSYTRSIKALLSDLGLSETVTYSLTSKERISEFSQENPIKVLSPITEDREYLRTSLIPSLVDVLSYNKARKNENMSIFEISELYAENKRYQRLAAAFTGIYSRSLWQRETKKVDFFLVKGVLEQMFKRLGIEVSFVKGEKENLHPGKTALIMAGDKELGYVGELHPTYQKQYDLSETYVFELDYNLLLDLADNNVGYHLFSKYPSITRDLAIVCDKNIEAVKIENLIRQTARKTLVSIELFDIYEDEVLGENKRQLAYKLTFADNDKTLETADVDKTIKSILNRLAFEFNATLRN